MSTNATRSAVTHLAWDSKHFGFSVGQIRTPHLSTAGLESALACARAENIRLVYYFTNPQTVVPPHCLAQFSGREVDRRATFERTFDSTTQLNNSASECDTVIRELPRGPADEDLLALGVLAGEKSRFRMDPSIPRERFETLYRQWIDRSSRREIADTVFVAEAKNDRPFGMVTVAIQDNIGAIGLIAVADEAQGRGVGRRLIHTVHQWLIDRQVRRSLVVTQLANERACRLYQRNGYMLTNVEHVYHFWL